ncbi:unnamed protein product [Caenorhabditis sp. 36 PRJEB53466]|nr:unnamed protein product [Caenorhabditis sp. 36 PRJEB53466]
MYAALSFLAIINISCTADIFIFWGYPTDGIDGCMNTTSDSFDACVTACTNSSLYMLAYGNDDYCMLCMFTVSTIAQSDKANGVKTAIKLSDPTDGCPTKMQSETYSGIANNNSYNVSYSNGYWQITYENKSCIDSTWTKFYRPAGQFCLKVLGSSALIDRDSSVTQCTAYNASLAGIQSQDEMDFIIAQSESLSGNLSQYLYTAMWIAGVRPNSCNTANAETTVASCAGLGSFVFNDPYMTSYSMLNFAPGFPDSVVDRGIRRNCIQLYMAQSQSAWQGMIGDAVCGYACNSNSTVCATTYLCGAAAT